MSDRPGWVICSTCDGDGALGGCGECTDNHLHDYTVCPYCSSGRVPSDGLVEVAAKAAHSVGDGWTVHAAMQNLRRAQTRRALIAADRYEREQEQG